MDKISAKMKILTLVAICSFLILPAISAAGEVELGTVEFGPGDHTESFSIGAKTMYMTASPALKSISVSVQNGTKRGKDRVSSAVVSVNGEELFVQKNFNQNTVSSLIGEINVTDPAMDNVELSVRVKGRRDARLYITVTAIYEEFANVPWFLDTDNPPNGIGGPIMAMGTIDSPPPLDIRGIWVPVGGDTQ